MHWQAGVGLGLSLSSSAVKIRPGGKRRPSGAPGDQTQLDRLYLPLPRVPGRCDFTLGRPLSRRAMRELGSRSRSAMSSPAKAAAASSCLSSQCFDLLTRSCVKCSDLFKENTSKGTRAAGDRAPQGLAVVGQGDWGHPGVGRWRGPSPVDGGGGGGGGQSAAFTWRRSRRREEEGRQFLRGEHGAGRRGMIQPGAGVSARPRGDHGKSRMPSSPTSQERQRVG